VAQRTHELDEKNQALQQALRSLEDVERIARHDLKTPLVSISTAPGLLRAGRSVSQQEEEILCMIESASSRALSMVNLSLDLFCMESGSYVFRPTRVDLCAIVSSVAMGLAGHARSKSVIISVPEDPAHAYVEAEDSLCYSIIGNLIKNAVEAAPEHSVISISLIAGPKVQLNIHNQGAVPGALRASFFEKYSTSGKVGGTGLGTYSSHLLARVQGGSLQMQTSDEDGTTLSLVLNASMPVSGHITQGSTAQHSTAQIVTSGAKPQSNQPTGLHVLFVDDDDFSHMVMGEYVPQPRFSLDSAINGRMALDCVTARRPDLIIMDIEMPVMGGVEALEKIRAHQISTQQKPSYIVAYSGNDDALSRDRYRELGFDECLPKPGAREDVERLLNSLAILVSN
jgi:CheY-like chemotaxis protein